MILLFLDLKETLFIPQRVEDHNELHSTPQSHCKEPIPKIRNKYSQRRNCMTTVPISTFICLWAIYIFPWSICLFCCRKYVDRSWEYRNLSQTHECGNWGWGRAIPREGIHKWDFRCSVWTILGIYKSLTDTWMRKLGLLEAAQFSEKEYINEIFVAVHLGICAATAKSQTWVFFRTT